MINLDRYYNNDFEHKIQVELDDYDEYFDDELYEGLLIKCQTNTFIIITVIVSKVWELCHYN